MAVPSVARPLTMSRSVETTRTSSSSLLKPTASGCNQYNHLFFFVLFLFPIMTHTTLVPRRFLFLTPSLSYSYPVTAFVTTHSPFSCPSDMCTFSQYYVPSHSFCRFLTFRSSFESTGILKLVAPAPYRRSFLSRFSEISALNGK